MKMDFIGFKVWFNRMDRRTDGGSTTHSPTEKEKEKNLMAEYVLILSYAFVYSFCKCKREKRGGGEGRPARKDKLTSPNRSDVVLEDERQHIHQYIYIKKQKSMPLLSPYFFSSLFPFLLLFPSLSLPSPSSLLSPLKKHPIKKSKIKLKSNKPPPPFQNPLLSKKYIKRQSWHPSPSLPHASHKSHINITPKRGP